LRMTEMMMAAGRPYELPARGFKPPDDLTARKALGHLTPKIHTICV